MNVPAPKRTTGEFIGFVASQDSGQNFEVFYDIENVTYVIKEEGSRSANATGIALSQEEALQKADHYIQRRKTGPLGLVESTS
jgi:hypothetical protein